MNTRTVVLLISSMLFACGVTGPATKASLESLCVENCDRAWKVGCRKDHDCSHCAVDARSAERTGCMDESSAFQECVSVHLCNSAPCYDEAEAASRCSAKTQ